MDVAQEWISREDCDHGLSTHSVATCWRQMLEIYKHCSRLWLKIFHFFYQYRSFKHSN